MNDIYSSFIIGIGILVFYLLGVFLEKQFGSQVLHIVLLVMFIIFVAVSVYYIGYRKFSFVKDAGEIIHREDATVPFNVGVFLLIAAGVIFFPIISFLFFSSGEKIYATFFIILAVVALLEIPLFIFYRKANIVFTQDGITMNSPVSFLTGKKQILFYKNINQYEIVGNVLKIYPTGQKVAGLDYLVTPFEFTIKNKEKIEEILSSKINH